VRHLRAVGQLLVRTPPDRIVGERRRLAARILLPDLPPRPLAA
jgi:hypothetical protein